MSFYIPSWRVRQYAARHELPEEDAYRELCREYGRRSALARRRGASRKREEERFQQMKERRPDLYE